MNATARDDTPGQHVVGRDDDLAAVARWVDGLTRQGGCLLITGDPGVGKTAVLEVSARTAADRIGADVLRAGGYEYEPELSLGGLHQLMLPVAHTLAAVPEPHRSVLSVALGLSAGEPAGQLPLITALWTWLRELSAETPLVLVFDDLQWADRATARTLGLLARRLDGIPVGLLVAQRTGQESLLGERGISQLALSPLDDLDAHEVLRIHTPQLHPSARSRLVVEAGGNPLALVELPRSLNPSQLAGGEALPLVVPLTDRLRQLFVGRVEQLPRSTRRLLLLAALNGDGGVPLSALVAGSTQDLARGEEAGLVRVDPGTRQLRFRHPLTRAAVVDLATPSERRSAHLQLAQASADPYVRAMHRGEAAVGFDDIAARDLEEAAMTSLRRGDAAQAVSVLVRAAELTSGPDLRSRRLAQAAYLASHVSGALPGARAILQRARAVDPSVTQTLLNAAAAASHLINEEGAIDIAHRMLVAALAHVDPDVPDSAVEAAITTLLVVCTFGGRLDLWEAWDEAVSRLADRLPRAFVVSAVTFADPARSTPALLAEVDDLVSAAEGDHNPLNVVSAALAGHYVDRIPRGALERVAGDARAGSAIAAGVNCLIILAAHDYLSGEWERAAALADECIDLCREHGYRTLEWGALNTRLLIAAARGDRAFVDDSHDEMRRWAIPRRLGAVETFTANIDGNLALGEGRYGDAFEHYSRISAPGSFPAHDQVSMWSLLDVIDACVGAGRLEEGRAHLRAARALGLPEVSPRLRYLSAAASALLAPEEHLHTAYEAVTSDPDGVRWPFYLARVEYNFGDRLRHRRENKLARGHLERAVAIFAQLGATPWRARAEAALKATGKTRHRGGISDQAELTPQEAEVVRLAASGLSNKEIGERLFLSARTVGGHLYRAFPKLGVTSRAALRDALLRDDDPE